MEKRGPATFHLPPISPSRFYATKNDSKAIAATPKSSRPTKFDPNTPVTRKASGIMPFTSLHYSRDVKMSEMAREIHLKCRPLDPQTFLNKFLPDKYPDRPNINVAAFTAISGMDVEVDTYDPLIKALAPFCPSLQLLNTHAIPDTESGIFKADMLKPDISAYKSNETIEPITQFSRMETHIEVKLSAADDAFRDSSVFFEPESKASEDTRGQITSYANAQMASQHRTHLFTVLLCADKARLLRWDRSGVAVTHSFLYASKKSDYLQEFFWRLSNADAATRGWDTSVTEPTADEDYRARRELTGLKQNETLYKFAVYDDNNRDAEPSFVVAGQPFTLSHASPTGRASRCYIAYDLSRNRVVLLKDTWRILAPDFLAEGKIYEQLHEAGVPHIAEFLAAGDISGKDHKTYVEWCINVQQRQHQHYRLVLGTIGRDLTSFESSWEMVNAVKDAIKAHEQAVIKVKIMHRDISVGNILITEDCDGNVGGVLIDWDLAKSIQDLNKGPRSIERTGTWQFISARLLLDKTALHTVSDDLESFVHVLTWVILRFTPSALTADKLASLLKRWYEEAEDILDDSDGSGGYAVGGGQTKQTALSTAFTIVRGVKLLNKNLDSLLTTLLRGFGVRYDSELYVTTLERDPVAAQALLDRIENHKWILEAVSIALNDRSAWPASDRSRDNPVLKVEATALSRLKRKSEQDQQNDFTRPTQKVRFINEETRDADQDEEGSVGEKETAEKEWDM